MILKILMIELDKYGYLISGDLGYKPGVVEQAIFE